MKKIALNLEFEDFTELKILMTSQYPFGQMFESKATVEEAEAVVKKSRKKKEAIPEAPVEDAPVVQPPVQEAPIEPVPVVAPTTAPVAPAVPVPAAPVAPVHVAPTAAITYTVDDLSKAGAAICTAGKRAEVVGALMQLGATNILELKPEMYAAFAQSLRNLGAQI